MRPAIVLAVLLASSTARAESDDKSPTVATVASVGVTVGSLAGAIGRSALGAFPRLRRLPDRIETIVGDLADGKLTVKIRLFADDRDRRVVAEFGERLAERRDERRRQTVVGLGTVESQDADRALALDE